MKGLRHIYLPILLLLSISYQPLQAQLGFDLDIKKPKPYEERELRSEKTGSKKLKFHKRIWQNTITHYNYFFNANNKINEVINRAKAEHKDDYAQLLPFYNYTLEATSGFKQDLDSVIYKSKTGIVLHDLRNDWIDDLYLLWGKAYYLQQQYDSAYQMFQFINYAFADKEADGYYKYIGSRMDGNTANSIVTKEEASTLKRMVSDPPNRNNALLWKVRTLIQSNAMAEAGSLMEALKNDLAYPERLQPALNEVQAYWFYRQSRWDSAASHLIAGLDVASNKQERARWEYLIGQLYEKAGQLEKASEFFNKSIAHTTDPVMDIYARLNLIRINKEGGDDYLEKNIGELLKMAGREKYVDYRDVIYYMAAQMELTRNNYAKAQDYFLKAAQYKNGNLSSSNQGYLQLADLSYSQKQYREAAVFYDSVQVENLSTEIAQRITDRKEILSRLVTITDIINRQDSLQRIAAMPEDDREDYIRKMVRQLRRQRGLKEEGTTLSTGNGAVTTRSDKNETDLFSSNSKGEKGEWYFYNDVSKTKGAAAFQQVWGNRPNVDNWRRAANVVAELRNTLPNNTRGVPVTGTTEDPNSSLTYEGLLANLPLTEPQVQASNDSIVNAQYFLGRIYVDELENYESAIKTLESLLERSQGFGEKDEVLFQLYYSYTKLGNTAKADSVKNLLNTQYADSRYTSIVNTGIDPNSSKAPTEVTKTYEGIYDLFIEGRFDEAKNAKQEADSLYNTKYWQPQLLYIEAVYHIRQREDSIAKTFLNTLIQQNGGTPMADKATTLLNVLNRRQQIEQELTNLQIERPVEEPAKPAEVREAPVVINRAQQVATDTVAKKDIAIDQGAPKANKDTIAIKPEPPKISNVYTYQPNAKHFAIVVLNKVDVVFGNEAKNAFTRYHREKYYNQPLQTNLVQLNEDNKLLVIGDFSNIQDVVDYLQKSKPLAATEIMPWMKKEKYTFTIISEANFQLLQEKQDLEAYQKFLDQNLPVKF